MFLIQPARWSSGQANDFLLRVAFATALATLALQPAVQADELEASLDQATARSGVLVDDHEASRDESTHTGVRRMVFDGDLKALHALSPVRALVVFSQPTDMPDLGLVEPRDVVEFDTGRFSIWLDGEARGIPKGSKIDALALVGADTYISLDTTADFGPFVADDEDLILLGSGSTQLAFDGSAEGIDPGLDLDGLHIDPDGNIIVSFDGAGTADGIFFEDEDLLLWDQSTFDLFDDGSLSLTGSFEALRADLDAVTVNPESLHFGDFEPASIVRWN